ncbi:hypothetical protein BKA59DRAFT_521537 [Fusarium tricinctum]|uniref:Uncharacterized protein n=1 Tax=Fusarium tricinctum TaxID=61284 RepID=A0A8K0WE83_9HYPO|nr:hypothetical protein BKA59DRAFT_521537 [Fusarium tricinctum]
MAPSPDPTHNRTYQKFHPACYGRRYINSVNNGSFDDHIDVGIQQQHDAYLEQIYEVGSRFISVFRNSLGDALQYRATGKDRKEAFESWKIMLDSALCLFILSDMILTPEAAHASFNRFSKTFCQSLAQPVSGHEISAPIIALDTSAILVSIFEANLNVLLNQSSGDTSWDKDNEKLYAFLTNLSATKSPSFPPVWATEPTSADEQGLLLK